jgi:formate/nitrite transporter FocA (FNT family)
MYYKSVLAGVVIALGSYCYLTVGELPGALMFSLGLLVVIHLKLPLYTGKVSSFENYKPWHCLLSILTLNLSGAAAFSFLTIKNTSVVLKAITLVTGKLDKDLYTVFADAIICGICVSVAVKSKSEIVTILAVATFVICKAEHCIADMYYFTSAGAFTLKALIFFIVVIAGNTVGGLIFALYDEKKENIIKNE